MKFWKNIRLWILATLLIVAAYCVGQNLGYRRGIAEQLGGEGRFRTAVVEWFPDSRHVLLYLNNGSRGFAFSLPLEGTYLHYRSEISVWSCEHGNYAQMRNVSDWVRKHTDLRPEPADYGVLVDQEDDGEYPIQPWMKEAPQKQ